MSEGANPATADSAPAPATPQPRKFLVVVDKTPECHVAVRFATRRAQHTKGRVTLFCVSQPEDFQQWRGVAEIMKDEAHQEAENLIYEAARVVNELSGIIPELVILEGRPAECLAEHIRNDKDISILVLAAGTAPDVAAQAPAPLASGEIGPVRYAT